MKRTLALTTYLVPDYDEAIDWFVRVLGFVLLEDNDLGDGKRWVRVATSADAAAALLLARADTPAQQARIGDQTGGRVGHFLHTDDFARDHARLAAAGAHFEEPPRREDYGNVVVFRDLYGNRWDLIGPRR